MKAVILNSADKIKGIIGMKRTVVTSEGTNYFGTSAYHDAHIPVDREMGVGHLNANRAKIQHAAGEQDPGNVGLIGWDYFVHDDPENPISYILQLNAGDYVSATLVWDRLLLLETADPLQYHRNDEFTDLGFENLDLELVHVFPGGETVIEESNSTAWNLEHIFSRVPENGFYHLRVYLQDLELVEVPYAIAWWAGADERPDPGDFNADGNVDAADYVVWRKDDGSNESYNEWRANFGNTSGSGSLIAAPEPAAVSLAALRLVCGLRVRSSASHFNRLAGHAYDDPLGMQRQQRSRFHDRGQVGIQCAVFRAAC